MPVHSHFFWVNSWFRCVYFEKVILGHGFIEIIYIDKDILVVQNICHGLYLIHKHWQVSVHFTALQVLLGGIVFIYKGVLGIVFIYKGVLGMSLTGDSL